MHNMLKYNLLKTI